LACSAVPQSTAQPRAPTSTIGSGAVDFMNYAQASLFYPHLCVKVYSGPQSHLGCPDEFVRVTLFVGRQFFNKTASARDRSLRNTICRPLAAVYLRCGMSIVFKYLGYRNLGQKKWTEKKS
jgi:hypothetical protein